MVEAASVTSRRPVGFLLSVLVAVFTIVLWATVIASPSEVTMPTIGFTEAIAHKQVLNPDQPAVPTRDLGQSAAANRALNEATESPFVPDALEESASANRALNQP
jgi:hypothetical protein